MMSASLPVLYKFMSWCFACRYFSLQAAEPLNMEDSVRIDVENRICDEHGPRADSYLRPQLVAFHTMNEV